jgi:hypothetical protein
MASRTGSVVAIWRARLQHTDCRQSRPNPARQYLSDVMDERRSTWCWCFRRRPPSCLGECLDQHSNHSRNLGELHGRGGHAHTVAPVTEYDQLPGRVPGDAQVPAGVPSIRYLQPRGFAAHGSSMYLRNALVDEHRPD